jgi:hypothetical protein
VVPILALIMEYKMKKYTFKGILLAMGLVFATLSPQNPN